VRPRVRAADEEASAAPHELDRTIREHRIRDATYGHLAPDAEEQERSLLDTSTASENLQPRLPAGDSADDCGSQRMSVWRRSTTAFGH
jgi:hypothetical protein